jgi:hypothetical protein
LRTDPRTATPKVPPTCRAAEIKADPTPLRSPVSRPSAALIAGGSATPVPMPPMVSHVAANPVPFPLPVNAAMISPTAATTKPMTTAIFGPALVEIRSPERATRRSHPTKPTSTSAPATMNATALRLPQPWSPASITP